jgi:hypothetical protein
LISPSGVGDYRASTRGETEDHGEISGPPDEPEPPSCESSSVGGGPPEEPEVEVAEGDEGPDPPEDDSTGAVSVGGASTVVSARSSDPPWDEPDESDEPDDRDESDEPDEPLPLPEPPLLPPPEPPLLVLVCSE